jgi:hypothetical protein
VTKRSVGAILAVTALVALSVMTGSTAAYAAIPGPPTISQLFTPWNTAFEQPVLQGLKDIDVTQIDVYLSNDVVSNEPYCTVPATDGATVWFTCTPTTATLAAGDNYLAATATNADGTSVLGPSILINLVSPAYVDSPADETYTNDPTPDFSGTAGGPTVDVSAPATPDTLFLCSGVPVVGGVWSCTSSEVMPDGDYQILASSGTSDGTYWTGPTIHVDTTDPGPADITGPPGTTDPSGELFSSTTDAAPTITGTSEPFATIKMYQNYSPVGCVGGAPIADAAGNWSCTLAVPLPAPGVYVFGANQFDRAGNPVVEPSPDEQLELTYTDTTPPAPPVVTSPIGNIALGVNTVITNQALATVTGTGEPGATLDVVGNTCMIVPTIVDSGGNWSCQLTTPMTPDGDYDVYFGLTDASLNSSPLASPSLRFTIDTVAPEAPTVWTPSGTTSGGVLYASTTSLHPVITGLAEVGATVQIFRGSNPVPCVGGTPVGTEGGFSCEVASALAPGVYNFYLAQTDRAGNSSGAPVIRLHLTVLAPPAPPTPAVTTAPPWFLSFRSDSDDPAPGQNVTLEGDSLPVGATVVAELHSDPVPLGTTLVQDDGTFRLNTHIPNTVEPGDHHYVVTVTSLDGEVKTSELAVSVVAPPPVEEPATAPPSAAPDPNPGGGGHDPATADRSEPAAPSSLSTSLPTVQDILSNPLVLGAAAASSLALLFLVAFPAELLNSTLDENYERLFGRLPKLRMPWLVRLRDRLRRAPVVGGLALTALAALIMSFADPRFGFDLTSLRLFLACTIGMFVLGYVANVVTGLILRRRWSIASVIELQPFGLLVAIVGVILSRLLDFTPGLLIGLVLGLTLSASATLKDEVRAVLTWTAVILGVSILAWLCYSFLSGLVAPGTFFGALVDDSIVAIATEGISGLVIALLPIGFLDGRSLYRYSRMQWLGTYLLAVLAFFVIVVPSGALWGDISGPFWIWLTVLLVFAAVCVGVYLWFRAHPEPEETSIIQEVGSTSAEASVTGSRQTKSLQR